MTTRAALHETIDELPEGLLETLALAIENLRTAPLKFVVDNAPYDDEPVSPAQTRAIAEGEADLAAGRVFSGAEVRRMVEELA